MMVPKVLFLVVLFQCVVGEESTDSPASSASQAPLIFRGEIAKEGQFPFMASLVKNGLTDCGGSIIGPNLVLSAAHCVVEYCFHPRIEFNFEKKSAHCYIRKSTAIKILVGSIQWLYGIQYDMKKAIIHSEYDTENYRNDIALIQIVGTFQYSQTVKPVQFGDVKDDTTCTVIGWGRIESTSIPRYLRYVKIRTLNPVKCLEIFGTFNNYYFGEKHLCTVPDVGKGFCYGDSGGPLFCNGKVVGIVSYRFADCGSGAPEIYIKVHAYSDWIQINSGYVT